MRGRTVVATSGTAIGSSEGVVTKTEVGPSIAGAANDALAGGKVAVGPGFTSEGACGDANPVIQRHKHKTLRKVRCMNYFEYVLLYMIH
jgi:hypothetical protein